MAIAYLPAEEEDARETLRLVGVVWMVQVAWRRARRRDLDDGTGEVAGAMGLALAQCLATLGLGWLAEQAGRRAAHLQDPGRHDDAPVDRRR